MKVHFILRKSLNVNVNVMNKFLDVCLGLSVLLFGGTLVWYVVNMFMTLI
jgi:hypothetical protein